MINVYNQFVENIKRIRDLGSLYIGINTFTKGSLDLSDLLRTEIVLAVSAFDYFIHELCRIGMIEVAKGIRPKTDAFRRYQISLAAIDQLVSGVPEEVWLGNSVRDKHAWLSFQDPDKVAEAMRLISPIELWREVGNNLGMSAEDVKRNLKLIVERRNKIAHESDMDPTAPGARWPITEQQAKDAVDEIERIGTSIFHVVQ